MSTRASHRGNGSERHKPRNSRKELPNRPGDSQTRTTIAENLDLNISTDFLSLKKELRRVSMAPVDPKSMNLNFAKLAELDEEGDEHFMGSTFNKVNGQAPPTPDDVPISDLSYYKSNRLQEAETEAQRRGFDGDEDDTTIDDNYPSNKVHSYNYRYNDEVDEDPEPSGYGQHHAAEPQAAKKKQNRLSMGRFLGTNTSGDDDENSDQAPIRDSWLSQGSKAAKSAKSALSGISGISGVSGNSGGSGKASGAQSKKRNSKEKPWVSAPFGGNALNKLKKIIPVVNTSSNQDSEGTNHLQISHDPLATSETGPLFEHGQKVLQRMQGLEVSRTSLDHVESPHEQGREKARKTRQRRSVSFGENQHYEVEGSSIYADSETAELFRNQTQVSEGEASSMSNKSGIADILPFKLDDMKFGGMLPSMGKNNSGGRYGNRGYVSVSDTLAVYCSFLPFLKNISRTRTTEAIAERHIKAADRRRKRSHQFSKAFGVSQLKKLACF